MDSALIQILVVDDESAHAEAILRSFKDGRMEVNIQVARTISEYRRFKDVCPPDIALIDLNLPDGRAIELLSNPPEAGLFPILIMTSYGNEQIAVESVKAGALDYVVKSPETFAEMPRIIVRALREWRLLIERKNSEDVLWFIQKRYRFLFENMVEGYAFCRMLFAREIPEDFVIIDVNSSFEKVTSLKKVAGEKITVVVPGIQKSNPELLQIFGRVALSGMPERFETYVAPLGFWFSIAVYSPEKEYFVAVIDNITERKNAERSLQASLRFLEIVHKHTEISPLLKEFVSEIKDFTRCHSVGIRLLDEKGNIPYLAYEGFSSKFYEMENPLSVKTDQCMCINVIKGSTNPALPFYTKDGAFYMNGTTRFLATVSEAEKGGTRNTCNREGYESIALVPFRRGNRVLGLIHVADYKENMVPLNTVKMLEKVAMQLGTALNRLWAEQALRDSEQNYRTLADSGQALIWSMRPDKECDFFNRTWLDFTGRTHKEDLHNEWVVGIHPHDLLRCLEIFNGSFERRERFSIDYRRLRHDGEYRWLQEDGCPRYTALGEFTGFIGYSLDITERKLAEQIVTAQRSELAAIYENAPFIMLLIDKDRRVRKVNKAGATMTNSLAANMIDEQFGQALRCINALDNLEGCGFGHECDKCILRRIIQDTLETGTNHNQVEATMNVFINEKELEMSLLLSTTRLTIGIESVALVTIMDITAQKRMEQEAKHAQTKLIHANKMSSLGMLVSSVAHEVNNPNNFILFNSSLLSGAWKDIRPVLDSYATDELSFHIAGLPYAEMREAVPKLLGGITDGSRRIKDMVERLREISREDRSGLDGLMNVNTAVRSAVMILQNQIMKFTENFTLELAESLPAVRGSSQQIEQVVINLIQNALQALRDRKGSIKVITFFNHMKHQIVIEVRDTGQGISAQNLKRITEPFFTTKLDSGGTGLGLSISNSIVRDHHGILDYESEEGKGTTARVVLPEKES